VYEWQAVAVARYLAGRAKPLPPVEEQEAWERNRTALLKGGKSYYSIAPKFEEFFGFLRGIAGDPAPGTTGLSLPPFDQNWLKLWAGMVAPKIAAWEKARRTAEEKLQHPRAKL